ncbi:MAG: glycosyltransferase [Candidatus Fonsibacter sp.]
MIKNYNNKEIAIILPSKEFYNTNQAAAASIWVKDFNTIKNFSNKTIIYGNAANKKPLTKNFREIKINKFFFKNSNTYLNEIIKNIPKNIKLIEVHNRPHYFLKLKKKFPKVFFILVIHNDPNSLRGLKTIEEKKNLIKSIDKIVFVSEWCRNRFFNNTNIEKFINKSEIIYPAIPNIKPGKKEKKIIFVGKLNKAKGYDIFINAITKFLKKNSDWKVIVAGNEPRKTYNFEHKNLIKFNWISHKQILNLYKKTLISITPSSWEEPFGRTSMEASNLGNIVIHSGTGGLNETSNSKLILQKKTTAELYGILSGLAKKKFKQLQKIGFNNYLNKKIIFLENLQKFSKIKEYFLKKFNETLNFNINKKILPKVIHLSSFSERLDYRNFDLNIAHKLSYGLIKNNVKTFNFSDRFQGYKSFTQSLDNKLLNVSNNIKPDLIIIGHSNKLSKQTLNILKNKNKNLILSFWYEDSISSLGPDYESNKKFVENYIDTIDHFFFTTHPKMVEACKNKNKYFLPIPCSDQFEDLEAYKNKYPLYDIFFALSHGVNRGNLKEGKTDEREDILNFINRNIDGINSNFIGINNREPVWGENYKKELFNSKIGLNLSRGKPVKYYSSNRIASLVANGIPTLMNKKTDYDDFFKKDEMIFYNDEYGDLIEKINFYLKHEKERIKIGKKGKKKYYDLFNNTYIADYIISTSLGIKPKYFYKWQ